jgi:hypothetical protein
VAKRFRVCDIRAQSSLGDVVNIVTAFIAVGERRRSVGSRVEAASVGSEGRCGREAKFQFACAVRSLYLSDSRTPVQVVCGLAWLCYYDTGSEALATSSSLS